MVISIKNIIKGVYLGSLIVTVITIIIWSL